MDMYGEWPLLLELPPAELLELSGAKLLELLRTALELAKTELLELAPNALLELPPPGLPPSPDWLWVSHDDVLPPTLANATFSHRARTGD